MARVPVHRTREQWLATAVGALRPRLREHAGLSVPCVRVSCGVHSHGRRGEVYIGNTVDDVPEVNLSLAHTAEASSVLGTLMRLCIYVATGSQTHGRNFQFVARQCGLAPLEGKWATAGYPDATAIPLMAPRGLGPTGAVAGAASPGRTPKEEAAVAMDHGGL